MESQIACHECDLLHRVQPLPANATARCIRCGAVLYRRKKNSLDRTLALALAGLILFGLANAFPFLTFKLQAQIRETTLITGIRELYAQGLQEIAALVMLTTVLVPLAQLLGILYVLLPLKFNRQPPKLMPVFRLVHSIQPWSMMEVFMLGILVSFVKLAKMAQMIPGVALFSFLALIFVLAAVTASLDPQIVWDRWDQRR
jgi:paraquat-inducible protein A